MLGFSSRAVLALSILICVSSAYGDNKLAVIPAIFPLLLDDDDDNDMVSDGEDNCPFIANSDQLNSDNDPQGDACDADDDNDTIADGSDNCPLIANSDQIDSDNDLVGDVCDDTPLPATEDLSELYVCSIVNAGFFGSGRNGLFVSSNLGALPDNTGTRGPFRVSVSATCIDNTFRGEFNERATVSDTYDFPTTVGNPTGRLTGAQSEFGSFSGSQPFAYTDREDNIFGADFCDVFSFFTDITVTLTPLPSTTSGIPQLVGSVTCEGRFGDG